MIGTNQYRAQRGQCQGFLYPSYARFLNSILLEMLKLVIPLSNNSAKIYSDRVDAFGNTFITLILLDLRQFQEDAKELLSSQAQSVQSIVMQQLEKMLTDRQLNLQSIEKRNRLIFVQNFREFLRQMVAVSSVL